MSPEMPGHDRLNSWKEIAGYVGRDVRTVIRWEQRAGLPVHRIPVGQRQAVHAYRSEIDAWMRRGPERVLDPPTIDRVNFAVLNVQNSREAAGFVVTESAAGRPDRHSAGSPLTRKKSLWISLSGFALLAGFTVFTYSLVVQRQMVFTKVTQVTKDGNEKQGLITDGRILYFGERRNARTQLAAVSVDGGPVRPINTPFVNAVPTDISPDGKNLLVMDAEGQEQERQLWIVPVDGRAPRRVGAILCHSAAWSPDGHHIAFAFRNGIYLSDSLGGSVQLLQTFPQIPGMLRWFRDASGFRFTLLDPATGKSAIWQLALAAEPSPLVLSVARLGIRVDDCCGVLSRQDQYGASFLSGDGSASDRIFYLGPVNALHSGAARLQQMNRLLGAVEDLSLDPEGKRLFVLSDSADPTDPASEVWTDLVAFNIASRVFRPYMPGVAAEDLDFSRDGTRIAWVNPTDHRIWIGLPDGSDARRLPIADYDNELPRWAPDGKQIAFMAKFEGHPWRIFIASQDGTHLREASAGMDNQGAPTWSPDGRRIAYGNVLCEESNSCAIHLIDLSNGSESTLAGSEGLETARWSPDGRFIAALQPETREVFLFELRNGKWRKLAGGINGNNLNWSSDSRYLYASSPNGDKPEIVRLSPEDGSIAPAVDLSDFARLAGRVDPWFTLTPDGSIVFVRRHQPTEVYALSFE